MGRRLPTACTTSPRPPAPPLGAHSCSACNRLPVCLLPGQPWNPDPFIDQFCMPRLKTFHAALGHPPLQPSLAALNHLPLQQFFVTPKVEVKVPRQTLASPTLEPSLSEQLLKGCFHQAQQRWPPPAFCPTLASRALARHDGHTPGGATSSPVSYIPAPGGPYTYTKSPPALLELPPTMELPARLAVKAPVIFLEPHSSGGPPPAF